MFYHQPIKFTIRTQKTIKPHFEFLLSFFGCILLGYSHFSKSLLNFKFVSFHFIISISNIMDELCRLDLLINLQQEGFKEMLEEHVNFIPLTLAISVLWFSFLF